MAKPTVVVVGADKGGVGKTTVSRTLLDYFTRITCRHALSTPNRRRAPCKRFHPDIDRNRRRHLGPDQMRIFDTLSTTRQR